MLGLQLGTAGADRVIDHAGDCHPLRVELELAAGDARQVEKIVDQPRLEFDIAQGPLGLVLLEIARTGETLVSFRPSLVERRQAPAIRGAYTLLEALALATRPSGLTVEKTPTGTLTIAEAAPAPMDVPVAVNTQGLPRPPAAAPAEAMAVLPRVVVLGSSGPREDGLKALRSTSATRSDTLLADLPQSVSVLTGEALDLQGGAHLLYQIDEKEMVEDLLKNIRGDVRETLRKARIGYSDLNQDVANRSVSVTIRDPAHVQQAETELRKLATPLDSGAIVVVTGKDDHGDALTARYTIK